MKEFFLNLAASYQLLEPIGGVPSVSSGNASAYFTAVYKAALVLTVSLSLVMIVIGGVEYTLAWGPTSKATAKTRIWAAIGGLFLALISVLILRTINPALLSGEVSGV